MARTTSPAPADAAVGKEILAYCTSCKMDLNHIIVAMKGDRVAKAQCLTCKKEHAYKAPKGQTEPKKKRKKKDSDAPTSTTIEAEWEKLMNQHKNSPTKNYSMKTSFLLGDKVNHPTFGEGIVGRLIHPNKIEVFFRTDIKVLIHLSQSESLAIR